VLYRRHRFASRFGRKDVALLGAVDEAHGTLSAPATKRILERDCSLATVSKWRQCFALWGLRGLAVLEEPPPPGMSPWDGPAVAEKLDAGVHAVWRVLRREGIYCKGGVVGA
jgi:hypothetical protein